MRFVTMLLCLLFISYTAAQDFSQLSSYQNLQKAAKKTSLQLPEQPEIEHAVDEAEYIVGPGDVFNVIIGGQVDDEQQLMVSPEGELVFPAAGPIRVDGMVLKQAKKAIKTHLQRRYRAKDIAVSLVQLRTFRVAVSGAVYFPGLVVVNGMNRVSDALFLAGGLVEPPPPFPGPENPTKKERRAAKQQTETTISEEEYKELESAVASKRNIVVKRRNGAALRVDLLKFERAGDLDANPYLNDGDVIIVPTVQDDVGKVSIFGAVRSPGTFEYASGDRLRDVLDMAHWFSVNADSGKIEIARFVENSSRAREIEVEFDWSDSARVQQALDTPLQPDDRIFVRSLPKFHRSRTVEIRGEVKYPGEYALLENATTLADIIDLAGGFTEEAALNAAYVVRRSYENRKDPDFERLEFMTVQEMERSEKAYYRERAREIKGLVSTDFIALFENGEEQYNIKLADKDLIVVPAKEYAVNVVGHVRHPGLVPFVPGKKAKYYIERTGGYNVGAWKSRVRVKKAGTGEMLSAKNTIVEMGDMVFVPEKIERENLIRDIALITVQVATVVLLVVQTNWYASNSNTFTR